MKQEWPSNGGLFMRSKTYAHMRIFVYRNHHDLDLCTYFEGSYICHVHPTFLARRTLRSLLMARTGFSYKCHCNIYVLVDAKSWLKQYGLFLVTTKQVWEHKALSVHWLLHRMFSCNNNRKLDLVIAKSIIIHPSSARILVTALTRFMYLYVFGI